MSDMRYESTRGNYTAQTASQAIILGMVPLGGLFVPAFFPQIEWAKLLNASYAEVALAVTEPFLSDLPREVVLKTAALYEDGRFETKNPAPLHDFGSLGILELWHGPTAAFKDMALQVLPHYLTASLRITGRSERVLILTATSGDTGKAALEGFKDVEGTQIIVFYPAGGVSWVQERQMVTTGGTNTRVVAVEGNFDQCQSAVKKVFSSSTLRDQAANAGKIFSSANSINWGRLLPQIVYYVWAYLQAVERGKVKAGETMNVVVPTGNYGNILAATYARRLGLPLGKLICASNRNNVLTDFFATGQYQSRRPFYLTISPSMDILISSNFERLLFEAAGRDSERLTTWFEDLEREGSFQVDNATLKACREEIWAGWCSEEDTLKAIKSVYEKHKYTLDPHTAVGFKVYEDYQKAESDGRYTILTSTASPFKFARSVLQALDPSAASSPEQVLLERLAVLSGWNIPDSLQAIFQKEAQVADVARPEDLFTVVRRFL